MEKLKDIKLAKDGFSGDFKSKMQEKTTTKVSKAVEKKGNISAPEFTSSGTTPNFTVHENPITKQVIETIYSEMLVQCNITIAGKEILKKANFELKISQRTSEHDEFEIKCYAESLESPNTLPLTKTREYLGKIATISFKQFGNKTYSFEGIITAINNDKFNNYEGNIIIKGNAPTILLENGLDCESYENKNLKSIIEKATEEYQGIDFDINPRTQDLFLYTVQYKESDFQFLRRMSERYGEWFYYNGEKIIFGKTEGKEVEILENQDVEQFEFRMKTLPQKFQYMAYNAKTAEMEEVNSEEISYSNVYNPYVVKALNASEEIYTKSPNMLYNQSLLESGRTELKSAVERQKKSRANVFEVYIKTTNPNIQIGDIVKLKSYMPGNKLLATTDVPLESYRVTEINHYHNGNEYYNEIIGVPRDQEISNYINEEAIPKCEEQSAIVTDNNDPQGMGRIRVQFPWQKPIGEQSPWIRLTTPYAGKGKGMHVVPEIGEEVLVGFESGNAEKPVILGAMFNGSGKSGHGGAGNYMKGLTTAAGCHVLFNDNTGSMTLSDKGNASLGFNGAGVSTLSASTNSNTVVGGTKEAPEGQSSLKMDSAGNITIEGKTNITLKVGKSEIILTEEDIKILAGGGDLKAKSLNNIEIEAETSSMNIKAKTDLNLESKNSKMVFSSKGEITTTDSLKISGGTVTDIKGDKVKINS